MIFIGLPLKNLPKFGNFNIIWKFSKNCCSGDVMDANPSVNWKGFMKSLHKPNVKARSQIEFLQIIDQPPDSYSTVYTTLIECLKTASAKPMVITFDLPLWLKASRIVLEKGMPVIVRLGGFHTLKSFLGCVGYIMADSGLEDLMRLVYPGDVTHIMDGGFLIDCALCCYLFEDKIAEEDLEDMASYIAKCSNEKLGLNHKTRVVQELLERIKKKFEILSSNSRTAALWTTYHWFHLLNKRFYKSRTAT